MPLEEILQEYLWRWDIEVNFRDEKRLLGVSEAQVRNPEAALRQPACAVAAYALLLLAAHRTYGPDRLPPSVPLAKRRRREPPATRHHRPARQPAAGRTVVAPPASGEFIAIQVQPPARPEAG